ncbi:acyl-CoA dehydrogenase [Novosphingobium endophyticum]|uniref:Acyl-CoA dehydrogenase n=1 Tax=Novosphingobium endophyticum TaxID=1955250 RepID=A0A916X690_9SPHN|nr:acyl-CoA dehydrogenase family protein [Novosphingobium endophyticum]GGC06994.1 acyl-CoA dehydrogenase [Novosphingobium endophyticum]
MDFVFTDEQVMIADTVSAFLVESATSERTRAAMAADGLDRSLWASFCEDLGLAGIGVPEESGGVGLGMVEQAIVAEAAGATVAPLPLLGHAMLVRAIVAGGSHEQKDTWLSRLVSGRIVGAVARAEHWQDKGSSLSLVADFVPHGASADLIMVCGEARAWLVDAAQPQVTRIGHVTMDQTRPLATVTLTEARVEELPDGPAAIAAAEVTGLLSLSAEALGVAQEALDRTVAYSKERIQFGRPIGSFQAYKHRLADMMVLIEQARSAVYWAACALDENDADAWLALHAAKSFCADTAFMCAANMIQLHGGIGFTWEHDAHLFFKRARSIQTLMGSGNHHREKVAAMVLGEAA